MKKKLLDSNAELLSRYLDAAPENTKDGGILRLKLPKVAKAEVLDLYLKVRSKGAKGEGLILTTKLPSAALGEIGDLYLNLRAEGTGKGDRPWQLSIGDPDYPH